MVSKSGLDLQRRDRSGPPRNLAPSDFFHVPAKPRQHRNSVPYLAAHGKCSRSRRLNRPKSSSVIMKKPKKPRPKKTKSKNQQIPQPTPPTAPPLIPSTTPALPYKSNSGNDQPQHKYGFWRCVEIAAAIAGLVAFSYLAFDLFYQTVP